MPILPVEFEDLSPSDHPSVSPVDQGAVDLLEAVTPVEKAQAVPFFTIKEIRRRQRQSDGSWQAVDVSPPVDLTRSFSQPPRFGSEAQVGRTRFRERPAVSFSRASVKSIVPRGIFQYRVISLSFVIHDPAAVLDLSQAERDQGPNFEDLLVPGNGFVLEYGWRASAGVKNPLLNGDGYDSSTGAPAGVVVPADIQIQFTVVDYSFKIGADNQVMLELHCYQDGDLNMRRVRVTTDESDEGDPYPFPIDPKSPQGLDEVKRIQQAVHKKLYDQGLVIKGKKGSDDRVKFRDLANVLLAPSLTLSFRSLGYDLPNLFFDRFNSRAGYTTRKFGGKDMSDQSIGEFELSLRSVERVLGTALRTGEQLTTQNFVGFFLNMIRSPSAWTRDGSHVIDGVVYQTMPQVASRTIVNNGQVNFYIFDVRRSYAQLSQSDVLPTAPDLTKAQLRELLRSKGVPMISFQRANSYLAEANFDCELDGNVKSLLMHKYYKSSDRLAVSSESSLSNRSSAIDPGALLYSSAIKGSVTMLGNFAFDMFGLVWLDFDVKRWSGPFWVDEREDVIEPGSFTTNLSFISAGTDPLGTQGRF